MQFVNITSIIMTNSVCKQCIFCKFNQLPVHVSYKKCAVHDYCINSYTLVWLLQHTCTLYGKDGTLKTFDLIWFHTINSNEVRQLGQVNVRSLIKYSIIHFLKSNSIKLRLHTALNQSWNPD